jgi:hypothetical protein
LKTCELNQIRTRIFLHEFDHLEGYDLYKDPGLLDRKAINDLKDNDFAMDKWFYEEKEKGFFI